MRHIIKITVGKQGYIFAFSFDARVIFQIEVQEAVGLVAYLL
jgi:hypothetical protein